MEIGPGSFMHAGLSFGDIPTRGISSRVTGSEEQGLIHEGSALVAFLRSESEEEFKDYFGEMTPDSMWCFVVSRDGKL